MKFRVLEPAEYTYTNQIWKTVLESSEGERILCVIDSDDNREVRNYSIVDGDNNEIRGAQVSEILRKHLDALFFELGDVEHYIKDIEHREGEDYVID